MKIDEEENNNKIDNAQKNGKQRWSYTLIFIFCAFDSNDQGTQLQVYFRRFTVVALNSKKNLAEEKFYCLSFTSVKQTKTQLICTDRFITYTFAVAVHIIHCEEYEYRY